MILCLVMNLVAMADRWVKEGARRLHLWNLNGAFDGVPVHKEVVTAITKRTYTAHSAGRRRAGVLRPFATI